MTENNSFLSEQIITYIGNKRALLDFIGTAVGVVKERLGKQRLSILDLFSGSGVVSRYLKQHSSVLYTNDLEDYSRIINSCYLANAPDRDLLNNILSQVTENPLSNGFITRMYAPADDDNVLPGERAFYTHRNAMYIDGVRRNISIIVPEELQHFFIAPLLYEASVHVNTSGVFKGFYKNKDGIGQFGGTARNALQRIRGEIELKLPVFSNFRCETHVMQMEALQATQSITDELDLAYMDPPYNQHPYGSNYFMLNLIANYKQPQDDIISRVSGIPNDWNRSVYNQKSLSQSHLFKTIESCNAKFILISYNSDGFVSMGDFIDFLQQHGTCQIYEQEYNTFRGCRNLHNRDIKVKEYLFLLERK